MKPQRPSGRREGQHCQRCDPRSRHQAELAGGPALNKRQFLRAEHMDDQGLAPHGFHKPARLKQGDEQRLARRVQRMEGPAAQGRAESEIQQQISEDVKYRADRADSHHKPSDRRRFPFSRLFQKFRIHIVPGHRRAGNVIDHVQQDQLDRRHGQKRQECAGRQHRKHISEIGRRRHFDVFYHVGIRFPPFADSLFQHHQILFQQHHLRRFLGNIHGAVHGNSHIRRFHGRRVVDPVSHIGNAVSVIPQAFHHPGLFRRRQLGEYRRLFTSFGQRRIVHILNFRSQEYPVRRYADLSADAGRHLLVIARQHLDLHARGLQRGHSCRSALLRRIQKSQISYQHHILFICGRKYACRRRVIFLCHAQHAHAFPVQPVRLSQYQLSHFLCQFRNPAVVFHERRNPKHFLNSSFGDHLLLSVFILYHDAHPAPLKIKRYLIYLGKPLFRSDQLLRAALQLAGPLYDRHVQQVFKPGLVIAVEKGVAQHPHVLPAVYIQMIFQHNLVSGQRSGLVRAENICRSQILNRIQIFYDYLFLRHGHRSPGQAGGHDHGKHLRRQAHGYRDGKQRRIHPVAVGKTVQEQHHRHHDQHEADQHPGNGIDAFFKGSFGGFYLQALRRLAQQRVIAH